MNNLVQHLFCSDFIGLACKFHVSPSSCDNPTHYEDYIRFSACTDFKSGVGVTHILLDGEQARIAGFVTLRATSLVSENEQGTMNVHPAIEIAELAVDAEYEQKGVGTGLLNIAVDFSDSLRSTCIGIKHIVVCADPKAIDFYKKFGFVDISAVYEVLHDGWNDNCSALLMTLPEI